MLSRLVLRSVFPKKTFYRYNTTMVATEHIEQDPIREAESVRDNLDIVKKYRADPEIIEYEAHSHSSASTKEHSLTFSVSTWTYAYKGFNCIHFFFFFSLKNKGFKRSRHAYC